MSLGAVDVTGIQLAPAGSVAMACEQFSAASVAMVVCVVVWADPLARKRQMPKTDAKTAMKTTARRTALDRRNVCDPMWDDGDDTVPAPSLKTEPINGHSLP